MPVSITQETFDEVVKENMEDFDMDRDAAVQDAIEQFEKQGADLTLVDTSLDGAGRDALVAIKASLETLRGLVRDAQWYNAEEVTARECVELLSKLGDLCREEGVVGERHKTSLGEAGGVGVIAGLMHTGEQGEAHLDSLPYEVIIKCLSTLQDACRNHEGNRHFFAQNMTQLNHLLMLMLMRGGDDDHATKGEAAGAGGVRDIVEEGLKLVRVACTKTESSKVSFMRHQGAMLLTAALRRYGSGNKDKDASVTKEACGALRSVTTGDDRTKDFSSTYDNVKQLVSKGAVPLLLEAARAFKAKASTLAGILLAVKQVAANDEAVKMIEENSGLDLIRAAMSDFPSDGSVCRASLSLLRNMCANDDFKAKLVSEGGLQLILGAMSQHKEDALLQEHGCGVLGAIALRSPSNGSRIVHEGGIQVMVESMRRHQSVRGLQRHACLCIRNIAARGPDLRQTMLDEGCEAALRDAGKISGCVDEAYMALRDLRCEVKLVTVGQDGQVQEGVQAFGEHRLNFNPSLDETRDLARKVQSSAAAPTNSGFRF